MKLKTNFEQKRYLQTDLYAPLPQLLGIAFEPNFCQFQEPLIFHNFFLRSFRAHPRWPEASQKAMHQRLRAFTPPVQLPALRARRASVSPFPPLY